MKMKIRDWLANLIKFRGQAEIDLEETEVALECFTRDDGTVEPRGRHPHKTVSLEAVAGSTAAHAFTAVPAKKYWLLIKTVHTNGTDSHFGHVATSVGKIGAQSSHAATQHADVFLERVRVDAGEVVTFTDDNFTAADAVETTLVYEEYDL